MAMDEIPDERLRIFISSAQSNEGIFACRDVRRRIKDYLKEFFTSGRLLLRMPEKNSLV